MTTVKKLGAAALGFLILGLSGCSKTPVLGVLLPTTGRAATYGESMSNAIHLALDEAYKNGSAPEGLKVVWADSASDPKVGVRELLKLAKDDGANMVIGGCTSAVAKAMLPVMNRRKILVLSPSASAPDLTKKSPYFFRVFPSDELEGIRAGTFLYQDQGRQKVVIFSSGTVHARGIEPEFRLQYEQNLGGKIVGRVLLTDSNWRQEGADILTSTQPDGAYVVAYARQTVQVIKLLRQNRFRGTICATSALYDRAVLDANEKILNDVYFPLPSFDPHSDKPVVKTFVTAYQARFGTEPDIFAAHAYDATRVSLFVLRKAKYLASDELRKTIHFDVTNFPGVTGEIRFDDYGDVHHIPVMYIIKNGKVLNFDVYRKKLLRQIQRKLRSLTNG
ncbi:MAG: amino acid ABC transporter substrate-binding protein [Acidobacteria bacterium]|nr:amino acid ABC transporter substrate-binding protein [Acidobacteriota bacterium]